jgi:hypothetical protein
MPMKKLDRERETRATVVWREAAMEGKPGKYISIENGPIADNSPKISITENLSFTFMAIRYENFQGNYYKNNK